MTYKKTGKKNAGSSFLATAHGNITNLYAVYRIPFFYTCKKMLLPMAIKSGEMTLIWV